MFAEVLSDVVGAEQVSVDSNFFDDLGADSMLMARFCARVRKRDDLPSVSIKDVYRFPTAHDLATAVAETEPTAAETPEPPEEPLRVSSARYVLCGALQLLFFLGYSLLAAQVLALGYEWISAASGELEIYLRSAAFAGAGFAGVCLLPVLVKWVLVGRWKEREIPVWSLGYVRFWIVKTLLRANPVVLFTGTPLYPLYLRALGARIGRRVVVLSRMLPVCTDLLSVGDDAVIRKDSYLNGYRAHAGRIQTGTVTLGERVHVGEAAVLDIGTSMGDGAQLGRASSLHPGQAVPAGEVWHGTPAQRAHADFDIIAPAPCGTPRRVVYSVLRLVALLALQLPVVIGGVVMLLAAVPQLAALLEPGPTALTTSAFYTDALVASLVLFLGSAVIGLVSVLTVPRLINLIIEPGKVYRLYGVQYFAHRVIARMTNVKFFTMLFGDSSYIVHYLRALGYDLSQVQQTGSNFGTEVKHDTPYLTGVGSATMVADGLSVINAEYSSTSFRMSRTAIGPHNFLGNHIVYPPGGRTGDDCLLATKVMVPTDGPVREGTGLLGAPSIPIPRTVQRDSDHVHPERRADLRSCLAAKNKHNLASMGVYLFVRWLHLFGIALIASAAADFYHWLGPPAIAFATVSSLLLTVVFYAVVERALTAIHPLRTVFCSIYDKRFWRHERFWKVPLTTYFHFFNGTPFKNLVWRMLGVRIGKRVFDDGCYLSERTMVTIGDDCTLNIGSRIQCHSQEDGAFKADYSTLGSGCTVGVNALVHYGVTMGDGAIVTSDAFLMKGEEMPPRAQWEGNPAKEISRRRPLPAR
ncbi:Pls/PosA family non-ribosomal peptide synthetase [Saccharopolyspora taberi]